MLLVDDDQTVAETFGMLMRRAGFDVATAGTARSALVAARAGFDVMLLDVRLGEDDGLDILRTLREEEIPGRVIVITGFDIDGIEPKARQLGADFVDRWTLPDPVDLVRQALTKVSHPHAASLPTPVVTPPPLARWAEAVACGVMAVDDPKSVSSWARVVARSSVSLRALCLRAGTSPKHSCTLVRILRAVYLARRSGRMDVSEWLDVGDDRTLERLLAAGGITRPGTASIEGVLRHQRLIGNQGAIALLSRALRAHGLSVV